MAALLVLSGVLPNPALTKKRDVNRVPKLQQINRKDAVAGEVLVKFGNLTDEATKDLIRHLFHNLVGWTLRLGQPDGTEQE